MSTVNIETDPCVVCGMPGTVEVWLREYMDWRAGMLIQDAFPALTPALREQILTGTHPVCWDEMFGDEDEDECPSGCTCAFCTA